MTGVLGLDEVKAATWNLHMRAERGGIIADILTGIASREGVALLLRNLLPVYQVLDTSRLCLPALARSAAIEADLRVLSPDGEPPLLPEGRDYADRARLAVQRDGGELIAHAYVRYLGDLNGGRIMQRRLVACLGDTAKALITHAYPTLPDPGDFARTYRAQLDQEVRDGTQDLVVREAIATFELNIALSEAVKARSLPVVPA
jgi:heme oxygenase